MFKKGLSLSLWNSAPFVHFTYLWVDFSIGLYRMWLQEVNKFLFDE